MRRVLALLWLLWGMGVAAASAQEVCVVCTEPNAVYNCSIEKSEKIAKLGGMADKLIDQVCARQIARSGKHGKCSARRDIAACAGKSHQITLKALLDGATAEATKAIGGAQPPAPAATPAPPAAPAAPASAPKAPATKTPPASTAEAPPPKTMQELAERTGQSKTWGCLASFFTKC